MDTNLKVNTFSILDFDDNNTANLDDKESNLKKISISKLVNDIVHSEEDHFMNILSAVQKFRLNEFNGIISSIMKDEKKINYMGYAKNLKNIIEHLLMIIKSNELKILHTLPVNQSDDLYLLSIQINQYITIISNGDKNKAIIGTELCIITAILNNMYDELLALIVRKLAETNTESEWISDEE